LLRSERCDHQQQRDAVLVGVDELRQAVRQTDVGNAANARLARHARVAVGHADDDAFLHALISWMLGSFAIALKIAASPVDGLKK